MNNLEQQQKNVEQLLTLIKENPTLRIMPMVDSEIVAGDDFSWWVASWGAAEVDETYSDDEYQRLRSVDEEELIDLEYDNLADETHLTDEEARELAQKIVADYDWEKVITVHIHTP